jgi:hypothetical protein
VAGEIALQASLSLSVGGCQISRSFSNRRDQSTANIRGQTLTVNGDVALDVSELTSPGYFWVQNIDLEGQTLELGPDVGGSIRPILELQPLDVAMFRITGTLRAQGTFVTFQYMVLDS